MRAGRLRIICVPRGGDLLFRTDSGVCGRQNGIVFPQIYLRCSAGCQGISVYLMLHRYELLAISDNLTELGIKRIRRVGHHTEFEQIKEYVKGDDYRTINWKASARGTNLW